MAEAGAKPSRWDSVTSRLVDYMLSENVLEVPREQLEELASVADEMVESDALIEADGRYSFFHETLFDYFVAQRFLSGDKSLPDVIASGEQPLTLRPLVRRVLQTQRDESFPKYIETVRLLLQRDDIRFLIKDAVLGVLAAVDAPQPAEWLAVSHLVEDPTQKGTSRAWRVVAQPQWFDLLDAMGTVERWLSADDGALADLGISILRSAGITRPSRVAQLAQDVFGRSAGWDRRVTWLLGTTDLSSDPAFIGLAADAIRRGLQDEADGTLSGELLIMAGHSLPERNPAGVVHLLQALIARGTALAAEQEETDPFSFKSGVMRIHDHERITRKAAEAAPGVFVEGLLQMMLDLARANLGSRHRPYRDSIWGYRHAGGRGDLEDELLIGMTKALGLLASNDPAAFTRHAVTLRRNDELETALALLYQAWSAAPVRYASDAIEFLTGSEDRLAAGTADRNYFETTQLIKAIAPHAPETELRSLEAFLMNFYSWWEREEAGQAEHGRAQAELLLAIPQQLRSPAAQERVEAARERFSPRSLEAEPEPIRVGYIGSPVDRDEAETYSDGQWLDAMRRYATGDERSFDDFTGGAHEFARVLEDFTKRYPDRFGRLLTSFPDDLNIAYFEAVLRGLGEAEYPPEPDVAFAAIRRCHALPGRPTGRWIARPAKHFVEHLPLAVLEDIAWYMTHASDPDYESWQTPAAGGEPYYGGDPYSAGINTARGSAAEDVAELIWPASDRLDAIRPDLRALVRDPIIAVRTCAATTLYAAYHHDEDFAVALFNELVRDAPDVLLAARPSERFLHFALRTHFDKVAPIIARMLDSAEAAVREVGGRQACFAALDHDGAAELAWRAVEGDVETRKGAAQVFAANVKTATSRSFCLEGLLRLFYDDDAEVRGEAAQCFRYLEDERLDGFRDLIDRFIDSPAFADDHFHLLHAIESSPVDLTRETVAAGRAFIARVISQNREEGSRTRPLHSSTLSTLLMRAYTRSSSAEVRKEALDVMDDLLAAQVYGIERELERFEAN